jgi:hypothetical protein
MGSAEPGDFSKERLLRALTATDPLGEVPRRPDDLRSGTASTSRRSRSASPQRWIRTRGSSLSMRKL